MAHRHTERPESALRQTIMQLDERAGAQPAGSWRERRAQWHENQVYLKECLQRYGGIVLGLYPTTNAVAERVRRHGFAAIQSSLIHVRQDDGRQHVLLWDEAAVAEAARIAYEFSEQAHDAAAQGAVLLARTERPHPAAHAGKVYAAHGAATMLLRIYPADEFGYLCEHPAQPALQPES